MDAEQVHAAVVLDGIALTQTRQASPLAVALPTIGDVLGPAARDCDAVVAVFDRQGRLIWSTGSSAALRRAEAIGFVEGSLWDERLAGTNAPGTALALDRAITVCGEEHFRHAVRGFGCVAAPIHGRDGALLGALDLTGRPDIVVPQSMAAVLATARLVENLILPVPATGAPGLRLSGLGRGRVRLSVDGEREFQLSPRHSEIVVLLAENPEGLTGDELAVGLYEDDVAASTLRAELNRLRNLLTDKVFGSRPYRLTAPVEADWSLVLEAVAAGDAQAALELYPGPLLPRSIAPGVVEVRDRVAFSVRQLLLDTADPATLARYACGVAGDDYEAWQVLAAHSGAPAGARSMARGQLARLDSQFG